ncbi:MAG: FecR domain-containing protein [Acidobacteria bacterium]|nr:FecR domain-containing protein [Acidobacteriota bacterium]
MFRLLLLLAPAALFAGQARFARLGDMDGKVEVQLRAADPWSPAERNLTLTEDAWLRTAAASRLEIELDEGSALRLGADALVELSDYTRLSTGQRITLLSLDHGVAYFTGEPKGNDALSLAVPGAQITLYRGARVRLQADDTASRVSVIEGTVRLSCPAAELDVPEGQSVRLEPANPARFSLDREIPAMELDRWSEERDKVLAAPVSGAHVTLPYGLADLDGAGEWVSTDIGAVWKPKVAEGWAPFQKGRWRWYDALGYTWVSDDSWGWLPYHYGRWTRKNDMGWVWVPPSRPVFKPGDVYWLYGRQIAGWGPLAPGEQWTPPSAPQQFFAVNTTWAAFAPEARVIDPAGGAVPKQPPPVAVLVAALPSPAMLPARLDAVRPALRVGATRPVAPVVPGVAYDADADTAAPPPAPPTVPPPVAPDPVLQAPPMDPLPPGAGVPPPPIMYPVPVYTGVVVINPPEHPDYARRNPNRGSGGGQPAVTPPAPLPARTNPSGGGGQKPPDVNRPAQPGKIPVPQITPTVPSRQVDPPRVGIPAPRPTDRPRIEAPPPRIEAPRPQPREASPPARSQSREESKPSTPSKPDQPDKTSRKQ